MKLRQKKNKEVEIAMSEYDLSPLMDFKTRILERFQTGADFEAVTGYKQVTKLNNFFRKDEENEDKDWSEGFQVPSSLSPSQAILRESLQLQASFEEFLSFIRRS